MPLQNTKPSMANIQNCLYKIEVHPSYSHQNMTQQYQKWPLQNHFRAKWGLSKCFFFCSPLVKLLFCRQSWGLNWWPCTGSRGNSTPLFCRENEHRDGEGPLHDVVGGKHDVRHGEIDERSIHVKGSKYSPKMKPSRMLDELDARSAVELQYG